MLYRLLRAYFRIALRAYYRDLRIVDASRVPAEGPLLLIGNHNNALIDPILAAMAIDRRVDFVGKSTIARMPVLGWLARRLGVIFVHRGQDVAHGANPRRNLAALDALTQRLEAGGAVCIFPEGKSHDQPSLARFKSGAARAALRYLERNPQRDLTILPFGLHFESPRGWRSRALLRFGEPISLRAWQAEAARADHRGLTERMQAAVADLTLNFDDPRDLDVMPGLAELLRSNEDEWRRGPALETRTALMARLIDRKARLDNEAAALIEPLRLRAARFQRDLDALKVDVVTLFTPSGPAPLLRFTLREGLFALLGLPLALVGALQLGLPWLATRLATARLSAKPIEIATRDVFTALVLFPPILVLQIAGVAWLFSPMWALTFALGLPLTASFLPTYTDRVGDAIRRAGAYLRLTRHPRERGRLVAEGRALIRRMGEIERSLGPQAFADTPAGLDRVEGPASDAIALSSSR